MNFLKLDEAFGSYRWLAAGVFAGVVVAEWLSRLLPPTVAWLAGGAVIGLVPAGLDASRSALRTALTTGATAGVAAFAHWLTTQLLP